MNRLKRLFFLQTAIVAMVRHNTTDTTENGANVTIGGNETGYSTTINPLAVPQSEEDAKDRFEWSAYEQNIILGKMSFELDLDLRISCNESFSGCFFWGYILTELPGGRLAELVGGRRVFGHSMLWASVLTVVTPAAALLHFNALVVVRVLLGFMLGK